MYILFFIIFLSGCLGGTRTPTPAAAVAATVPTPTIQFTVATMSVSEGVGTVNVEIDLSAASAVDVTVAYAVTGTVKIPTEVSLQNGTFTMEAGKTTKNLTFTVVDNGVYEGDKTMVLTLSSPVGATLGTNTVNTITIVDSNPTNYLTSGDIVVIAGGTASRNTSPFSLNQIIQFGTDGTFKRVLFQTTPTNILYGMTLNPAGTKLLFGVQGVDRISALDLSNLSILEFIDEVSLVGSPVTAFTKLSDNSYLIADSTTNIEKYTVDETTGITTHVTTGFPLTGAPINTPVSIKPISGNRFAVVQTAGTDIIRVYQNDGTLLGDFGNWTQVGCTGVTNCDPSDVVELQDGRFLVALNGTNSLELYTSGFAYIGQAFSDPTVLTQISQMAVRPDGSVLVCNIGYSTCELMTVSGNTATRVGSRAFIDAASLIHQPSSVMVVP